VRSVLRDVHEVTSSCRPEAAARRDAIVASAYEIAPRLAEAWDSFRRPDADLRPLIPRVTMPVLFAWAAEDRLVSFARSREAIERFPNHRVVMFRAGHSPFLETPRDLNAAVAAFLEGLRGA
jgi:pimeloyl-ACP methyl ester carboxylesterase